MAAVPNANNTGRSPGPGHSRDGETLKFFSTKFSCRACHSVVFPDPNGSYEFEVSGHVLCSKCAAACEPEPTSGNHGDEDEDVPSSRSITESKISESISQYEDVVFACANVGRGCKRKISTDELEAHIKSTCPFRQELLCGMSGCYAAVTSNNFIQHYTDSHSVPVVRGNSATVQIEFNHPERDGSLSKCFQRIGVVFFCFNTSFALSTRKNGDNFHLQLQTYDPSTNPSEFTAKVTTHLTKGKNTLLSLPICRWEDLRNPEESPSLRLSLSRDQPEVSPQCRYLGCTIEISKKQPDLFSTTLLSTDSSVKPTNTANVLKRREVDCDESQITKETELGNSESPSNSTAGPEEPKRDCKNLGNESLEEEAGLVNVEMSKLNATGLDKTQKPSVECNSAEEPPIEALSGEAINADQVPCSIPNELNEVVESATATRDADRAEDSLAVAVYVPREGDEDEQAVLPLRRRRCTIT